MAITLGGVTAEEYVRDYAEGLSRSQGPSGSKGYVLDWTDRYAFANAAMGLTTLTGPIAGGTITIAQALRHPETPRMLAQRIRIQGKGRPTQGAANISFPKAIVWVDFEIPPYSTSRQDDPQNSHNLDTATPLVYCEQELDFAGEILTIPGSGLKFANGNAYPNSKVNYGVPIGHVGLTIKLIRVPYLPAALVRTSVGTINNATFLGCATGKLRFEGAQSHRTVAADGYYTQDLTLRFLYRDLCRWDNEFDPVSGSFQQVQGNTGTFSGAAILPSGDLSTLIPAFYSTST